MHKLIGGYGRSGKAVAAILDSKNNLWDLYDEGSPEGISSSITLYSNPDKVNWALYDELILSPGIPDNHPLVLQAREHDVAVCSEIEFAFRHCRGPIIGVTGSNGKSSTVTMLETILKSVGRSVQLCGNIGKPFSRAVLEEPAACFVVEISSFQLETIQHFRAQTGILLNVTPDHLDRHGSFEAYESAKLRLFENQLESDLALIPPSYEHRIPGKGRTQIVHSPVISGDTLFVANNSYNLPNPALKPPHQKHNAAFAVLASLDMGLSHSQIEKGLNLFTGLKHRMEIVGTHLERTWINDSKATNTDSTQVAVYAMQEPYILILGGKNKDADFSVLDFSRNPPSKLIVYGKAAEEIAAALPQWNPRIVKPFRDACLHALQESQPGDTILMSPGCASFDQFGNFELRGEAFRELFFEIRNSEEQIK